MYKSKLSILILALTTNICFAGDVLKIETDDAFKSAIDDSKGSPTVIKFGTSWCPACKNMEPVFKELAKQSPQNIHFLEVDTDKVKNINPPMDKTLSPEEQAQQQQRFEIRGIPAFYFIDSKGKVAQQIVGVQSMVDLKNQAVKLD